MYASEPKVHVLWGTPSDAFEYRIYQLLLRATRTVELGMWYVVVVMTRADLEERLAKVLPALPTEVVCESDVREQRFIERELQLAIQAALDAASHIVSDERLPEPASNADLFAVLAKRGVIPAELESLLIKAAKFRNVLVHGYVDVDSAVLRDVVENHLGDLERFALAVRSFMSAED